MAVGFRIYTEITRPDPDLISRLARFSTTDIGDVMNHSGVMDPQIAPVFRPQRRIAGPAITLSVPTGAILLRKTAFMLAQPGDVLVINACANVRNAVVGGNFAKLLAERGVVGAVVDGAVRDRDEIRDSGLSVFCRATTIISTAGTGGFGEINVPIACGHVVVNPGDIIVADEDGCVTIPAGEAHLILADLERFVVKAARAEEQREHGQFSDAPAVENQLVDQGCEFIRGAWSPGSK